VVGSLNTDLVTYLEDVPQSGQTVFGRSFATGFGGKGSNQAAMASLCGAQVYMVGSLGDDAYGVATRDHLEKLGISSQFVGVAPTSSGVALIWVEASGANRIVIVSGANSHNSVEHTKAKLDQIAELDVVVGQFEIPVEVTTGAFSAAKSRGAVTVLNPAPAMALPEELLGTIDWLVPNEHEFEIIFSAKPTRDAIANAAVELFSKRLGHPQAGAGPNFGLVVTLGEQGAAVWSRDSQQVEVVNADSTDALDTTGAGDAFVGAFAVGIATGLKANQAALAGCLCATDSVKRPGAQESFPDRDFAKQALLNAVSL
jgi:ribokinase